MKTLRSALATGLLLASPLALAADYEIDPAHSQVQFAVRHLMVSNVKGEFGKLSGTIALDEKDLTKSTVTATIDATSINTREAKRDGHLKSADFLDVEKFSAITFKSKKVKKAGKDKLKVTGDLTLRGVTKEVTLDVLASPEVKDPWGNFKRGFSATTQISRKDFGLTWNQALEGGGVLVGDEVKIELEIEAAKKAAPTKT